MQTAPSLHTSGAVKGPGSCASRQGPQDTCTSVCTPGHRQPGWPGDSTVPAQRSNTLGQAGPAAQPVCPAGDTGGQQRTQSPTRISPGSERCDRRQARSQRRPGQGDIGLQRGRLMLCVKLLSQALNRLFFSSVLWGCFTVVLF